MKNKFSCIMALASMLFVSVVSTEASAGANANMNMNMAPDDAVMAMANISVGGLIPHGDLGMKFQYTDDNLKFLDGFATKAIATIDTTGASPSIVQTTGNSLHEAKDKYGWNVSGGIYSPMLFENMMLVGVEANWMQTTPDDDSKTLYTGATGDDREVTLNTTTASVAADLGGTDKDIFGSINYNGIKAYGANLVAKINMPFLSANDLSFYVPLSVGAMWAAPNDDYCEKGCTTSAAMAINGGVGISYNVGNNSNSHLGLEAKYNYINDLVVPFNKTKFTTVSSSTVTPNDVDLTSKKDAQLKLSPSYFAVQGNFTIGF